MTKRKTQSDSTETRGKWEKQGNVGLNLALFKPSGRFQLQPCLSGSVDAGGLSHNMDKIESTSRPGNTDFVEMMLHNQIGQPDSVPRLSRAVF